MTRRFFTLATLTLGLAAWGEVEAQTCESCTATVQYAVQLRIPESMGGIYGNPLGVAVDGRGRIWVMFQDQLPAVFESDGQFLSRFGRTGQGPGEFSNVTRVIPLPGDSVAIVDWGNQRLSIWGPELRLARSVRMEFPISQAGVLDWPKRVLISGPVLSPSGAGWPLHIVDLSGNAVDVKHSFGATQGEIRAGPSEMMRLTRVLSLADNGVWVADRYDTVARRWLDDWSEAEVRSTRVSWFGDPIAELVTFPIPNNVVGIHYERRDRLLRLYTGRVDRELLQEVFAAARSSGARSVSTSQMPPEAVYRRSRLLLLDDESTLVADLPLEGFVVDVAADGRALVARPDEMDVLWLSLERIEVEGG